MLQLSITWHFATNYRLKMSKHENENFFIEEDIGSTLLLTCNRDETRNLKFWYLGLGDSDHITGGKDIFFCIVDESVKDSISFGNKTKVSIMSRGDIIIRLKNEDYQFVFQTYYVPTLKTNILSIEQLLEKGYKIETNKKKLVKRYGTKRLIVKVTLLKANMFK